MKWWKIDQVSEFTRVSEITPVDGTLLMCAENAKMLKFRMTEVGRDSVQMCIGW